MAQSSDFGHYAAMPSSLGSSHNPQFINHNFMIEKFFFDYWQRSFCFLIANRFRLILNNIF